MFSSFRNRFNIRGGSSHRTHEENNVQEVHKNPDRNAYGRPSFLNQTHAELGACLDFTTRPIVVPKSETSLPWKAGYAECTSANKKKNEDQTAVGEVKLDHQLTRQQQDDLKFITEAHASVASIRGMYFGVFDGHGGHGASLIVADQLINHIQEKLVEVQKEIFELALIEKKQRAEQKKLLAPEDPSSSEEVERNASSNSSSPSKSKRSECKLSPSGITFDDLIVGALEASFRDMDEHIEREKASFNITGGCCALVALFICGKVYVANAGDCRAVAYIGNIPVPLSVDFKADRDMERIYHTAFCRPDLLGGVFTMDRYVRMTKLGPMHVGEKVWCKPPTYTGWTSKYMTKDDIKLPLIVGKGRTSRLMHTIGICRSLGDHDLCFETDHERVPIKPFLSSFPEVRILDLRDRSVSDADVMVIGSDGLWDVMSNKQAGEILSSPTEGEGDEVITHRYGKLARRLVSHVRGTEMPDNRGWKLASGKEASYDDISCLVIPLHQVAESTKLTFSYGHVFSQSSGSDSSS